MNETLEDWELWDKDEQDGIVHCDARCGAKDNPETYEEVCAALAHWRSHSTIAGCSHGR